MTHEQAALDPQRQKKRLEGVRHKGITPLVVKGVKIGKVVEIPATDLKKLGIDDRYQRWEIGSMVNRLIATLLRGGQIIRPISIAVRTDGSWWIVDGQQRYWAAYNCNAPLLGQLYDVPDFETEKALFLELNNSMRLTANLVVKSWPGVGGELIRRLNVDRASPLLGQVTFKGTGGRYGASTLAHGFFKCGTGTTSMGSIQDILRRLDRQIDDEGVDRSWRRLVAYVSLLKALFGDERVIQHAAKGLGLAAFAKWEHATAFEPPNGPEMKNLHRMNWTRWHGEAELSFLKAEILRRWRSGKLVRVSATVAA